MARSDTGPTYTEQTLQVRRVTLVLHPNTGDQRALVVIDGDRVDRRAAALRRARQHHPGQPLGWYDHNTHTTREVES